MKHQQFCPAPSLCFLTRGARTLMPTYTAAVRVKGGEGAKAWFPIHHRSSRSRHTNHTRGTRNADELIQPAPQNPTRCPSSRWRFTAQRGQVTTQGNTAVWEPRCLPLPSRRKSPPHLRDTSSGLPSPCWWSVIPVPTTLWSH